MHVRMSNHIDPDASAIVVVHGMIVSSLYSVPLAVELAKSANVYAIDLPGYGRSSKPRKTMSITELGGLVNAWLLQAGLTGVTVVANSYGCQVMAEAVIAGSERVRSLVFIGATIDPAAPGGFRQALRIARAIPFEPCGLFR